MSPPVRMQSKPQKDCKNVKSSIDPTGIKSSKVHRRGHSDFLCFSACQPGAQFTNKNSSGDEIANMNFLTTISHTRRPTSKYRKRDKPTLFNKLDNRQASTAHEVLNFSICYRISTSQLYNIPVASRGPFADDFGTNRKLIYDFLSR